MSSVQKNPEVVSLMARMMVPFRRVIGYSFDTGAFLEDPAYTQVIIQLAKDSNEPILQKLGFQLAALVPTNPDETYVQPSASSASFAAPQTKPEPEPAANLSSESEAERILRAELLRKYKGGIR